MYNSDEVHMMIPGEIEHDGKVWGVAVEALGAVAVGATRSQALAAMAATIIEHVSDYGPVGRLRVQVTDDGERTVYVTANEPLRLLALFLRRQRETTGLSLADVARKTGAKSRNGYAQYEQGRIEQPSLAKLEEMLAVVAPDFTIAVIPKTARVVSRDDDTYELGRLVGDPTRSVRALRDKHARTLAKPKASGISKAKTRARAG
jgi:transcriptional regulator with XRE-family HTH domain